eukprot:3335842-Rhodomonas_salina.1
MCAEHWRGPCGVQGSTAPDDAGHNVREGIARMLLEHNADPNSKDNRPVRLGLEEQRTREGVDAGTLALHCAGAQGHEGIARMLLEHNADPNARDNNVRLGCWVRGPGCVLGEITR